MVLVPIPAQGQRVARELSEGALVVIMDPGMNALIAGSAVFTTAVLAIPAIGVWFSTLVLMLGASAYGEIIRRVSRGRRDEPEPNWLNFLVPNTIPKTLVCFSMASGTVVPLWILNGGLHQSPHWDATGRVIAVLSWVVAPLLMVMLYGRGDQETTSGAWQCLKFLARHRLTTTLALAAVPLTLAVTEAAVGLVLYLTGNLPFYALDYMPMPTSAGKTVVYGGVAFLGRNDYRDMPDSMFIAGYFDGLRHGYSLVGAVPASLSLSSRAGLSADAIGAYESVYLLCRLYITLCVVTCLMTAFAIQARWLGAILASEKRRPA